MYRWKGISTYSEIATEARYTSRNYCGCVSNQKARRFVSFQFFCLNYKTSQLFTVLAIQLNLLVVLQSEVKEMSERFLVPSPELLLNPRRDGLSK